MDRCTVIDNAHRHEGLRLNPYRCTSGKLTIGYGRNLEGKGITNHEALMLLDNDIDEIFADLCRLFPDFHTYSENRQHALIDMRFMGPRAFRGFVRMIAAVKRQQWDEAAIEALDSKWARDDVGEERSGWVAQMLRGW